MVTNLQMNSLLTGCVLCVPSVKTIFHAQHLDQKQLAYKKQRHSKGVISCIYHLPETDNKHDLVLSHFLLKEILI